MLALFPGKADVGRPSIMDVVRGEAEEDDDPEVVVLADEEVWLGSTPMVVMADGAPVDHGQAPSGIRIQTSRCYHGTRTWEEQDLPSLLTAGLLLPTEVDAEVQVVSRIWTPEDAVPSVQGVDIFLYAEQRTAGAAPRLIRTRSPYKLGGIGRLHFFSCGLTQAVGQARETLATARRVRRVVPAGDIIGRDAAIGVVTNSCYPGPEAEQEEREHLEAAGIDHVVGDCKRISGWGQRRFKKHVWLLKLA